jgi:predicted Zn-dependent peptidase
MRTFKLIFSITLLSNLVTLAQVDRSLQPKPAPAPKINFGVPKEYQFENGVTLMVVENHKLPRVSVSLRVDNPLYLAKDKTGVQSLLGVMLGKGSINILKDDFEEEIDFMGASLNFSSSSASAGSLSRYFPRVFEMMADALLKPNFLQEEFEKEKKKILEGIKASEKDVKTVARRVENLLSYGKNHPYGEYASKASINKIKISDIEELYLKRFYPQNAYVIIVGDIDFKIAKKLTQRYFGKWKKGKITKSIFETPKNLDQTAISFVEMPNAVQSEISVLSIAEIDKNDPDYYPLLIANQILGGGAEARLFLNLREDKGYTYGSYSRYSFDHKTNSIFRAYASVRNTVTDSSVVELLYEIRKMSNELVSNDELSLVKKKYAGSLIRSMEQPSNIANFAYNIKTQKLSENFYNDLLKSIEKVNKEDIRRVSKKYLNPNNLSVIVTGKGSDVLKTLEDIEFEGRKLSVSYFDKYGNVSDRPVFYKPKTPEGTSAQSVINNYIKAVGGKERLEGVKTKITLLDGIMQGMTIQILNKQTNKNQLLTEVSMMGNIMQKTVLNQTKGYNETRGKKTEMKGKELEGFIKDAIIFPELKVDIDEIKLSGIVSLNGEDAYEIIWSNNKKVYYATSNYHKIQEVQSSEMRGKVINIIKEYSDYQSVEGILFPQKITQNMGSQKINFKVTSISLNEKLSEDEFE